MDFPQLGPLSNPFPWLLDTSNSALLEDRFCGRWRLQPFSSDGHPVFARYDCSEKGALGGRWGKRGTNWDLGRRQMGNR